MKNNEIIIKKHEAFGIACFRRINGEKNNFFGSSVECTHWIELEISKGQEYIWEDCGYRSFSATSEPPYIRIAFTPSQFAELITTLNCGEGVPCTVVRLNNQKVEEIPMSMRDNELDRQRKQFKSNMKRVEDKLNDKIERVKQLCSKPSLGKADRAELESLLTDGISRIKSELPYFTGLFNEAADKIVQEAKSELDSAIQHELAIAGAKSLGIGVEMLENTKQITE